MGVPPPVEAELTAALARVSTDEQSAVVFRSSLDRRLWTMASHVDGEDLLLCEAASDEFVGRHQHLRPGTLARLHELGWGSTSEDFTRWEAASSDAERAGLATVMWRTLVEAFGHEPGRAARRSISRSRSRGV